MKPLKKVRKNNSMKKLALFILFIACSEPNKFQTQENNKISLKVSFISSGLKTSSFIIHYGKDTFQTKLSILKKVKPFDRIRDFFIKSNICFELKTLNSFDSDKIDTLIIPYFTLNDTVFENIIEGGTLPTGWDNWRHEVKKIDSDKFSMVKTLIIDSTFKEIYHYDRNYKISHYEVYQGSDTIIFNN